jgi:hypothetical protein
VLSALHDLPLEHIHVQAQRQEIFEAIELENSQKAFNPVTLLWDNTGITLKLALATAYTNLLKSFKWAAVFGLHA